VFLALCLALDASRIFKKERDQQTLSSLMTLPLSTRRIIWEKTLGCLKASWPAIAGVVIGLSTLGLTVFSEIRRQAGQGQSYWSRDLYFGVFLFLHAVFTGLLLPVYIAWLSLRVRWGALPIGITIWFLGNFAIGAAMSLLAGEAAVIILPVISFCLLFTCWQNLPGKLEQLAAEE
jgi:ABC-type transport system involved in multi-copper enzyme maturation permease subunit